MILLAVLLVALALLFGLTTMALHAAGELDHPLRVAAALILLFIAGLTLLVAD